MMAEMGERYYRLGLGAAKRRDLNAAIAYADFASALDPGHGDAARLGEICRRELGEAEKEPEIEGIALLAKQKKWKAAAKAAKNIPCQNVRLLNMQGCLWALAKRYARAADCFAGALAKDRGNLLAAEALAELGRRRNRLGGFFAPL
jgi:tetratricopeptide (TPR) repeat protein